MISVGEQGQTKQAEKISMSSAIAQQKLSQRYKHSQEGGMQVSCRTEAALPPHHR